MIIDLLSFDEERQNRPGIPGAFRIDPARLRARSKVISPKDLGIILYCYSSSQLTSARVAVSLKKKGILSVWILEGGLAAWESAGLPVTSKLSTEQEVAERFGIQILDHETGQQLYPGTPTIGTAK